MRRANLTLILAAVGLTACSQEMSLRQIREAETAVENQLATWERAINNQELDTLLALHRQVPELTVVWPDGRVTKGWEEEEAAHEDFYRGIERVNFNMQRPEIQILGPDVALATFGHSTDIILEGGERDVPTSGHVTLVWVKDPTDGVWRIQLEHHSNRPPAEN